MRIYDDNSFSIPQPEFAGRTMAVLLPSRCPRLLLAPSRPESAGKAMAALLPDGAERHLGTAHLEGMFDE